MKNLFFAYLHSCGLSQQELTNIFSIEDSAENFYSNLSEVSLTPFVKSRERRKRILEKYEGLKCADIDSILVKLNVEITVLGDTRYPSALKNIPHTPFILYVRGCIPDQDMFGIVGSRKISGYGKSVISQIVPDVARVFPIVSGGAAGCDTYAHKSALDSGNITIVVVGTGIDQTYPVGNEQLFTQIIDKGGAVISIFRVGEPGNPYNFPVRNEIVVGLSRGVLVVEAQKKSGSLITARLALDLGKDLFSIPGNISSSGSTGTNMLIKRGEAKCVTESQDVLEEYDVLIKQCSHKEKITSLDDMEAEIYGLLSSENMDIDALSYKLGYPSREISMKISLLELRSVIKKDISGKYVLT